MLAALMYIFKKSLFTIQEPFLYIAWWSFLGAMIITWAVSLFTKPFPIEKIRDWFIIRYCTTIKFRRPLRKQIDL